MHVLAEGSASSFGCRIVTDGAGSNASSPALRAGAPLDFISFHVYYAAYLPVQK